MKNPIYFFVCAFIIMYSMSCTSNKKDEKLARENLPFPVERSNFLPDLRWRTITIVTTNDYEPLNFKDPHTQQPIGAEYDLTNTIAYVLNAKVVWARTRWDAMILDVRDQEYDAGVNGIAITKDREELVSFSVPYIHGAQTLLVRKEDYRFSSAQEFVANPYFTVGVRPNSRQFYAAVYGLLNGDESNPRIKPYSKYSNMIQALLSEDVDMLLMDTPLAREYLVTNSGVLKALDDTIGDEDFGYIFPPNSILRVPFNQAIDYLKTQGIIQQIERKWYVKYYTNK